MSRAAGVISAFALALVVFVVDQVIKRIVESSMSLGESAPLIPGVLHLTYIENEGGAFGIFSGSRFILLAGSAVAVAVVLWMLLSRSPSKLLAMGCGLILGGASGNLLDRLTSGVVTDYVDLRVWPIFNAADTAIVAGVVLLLLSTLRPEKAARDRQSTLGENQEADT